MSTVRELFRPPTRPHTSAHNARPRQVCRRRRPTRRPGQHRRPEADKSTPPAYPRPGVDGRREGPAHLPSSTTRIAHCQVQWARLGSNQRPLACESRARAATCRRLCSNPAISVILARVAPTALSSVAIGTSQESRRARHRPRVLGLRTGGSRGAWGASDRDWRVTCPRSDVTGAAAPCASGSLVRARAAPPKTGGARGRQPRG